MHGPFRSSFDTRDKELPLLKRRLTVCFLRGEDRFEHGSRQNSTGVASRTAGVLILLGVNLLLT